ncbi:MAG: hypothetical protein L0206_25835 [Actinobacteria bacterium]|nr:hypothetical protein [Actinomycetota bacterium]
MQRATVAATAVALALAGATAATPSTDAKPAIRVLDRAPLVIRGSGFHARVRVTVTATTELRRARRVAVTSRRGSFTVHFDFGLTPCTRATLVAAGARGPSVLLKLGLRECPGPTFDP